MAKEIDTQLIPHSPIIMRCHRIMETFAKSDDERDFYIDRVEGFIIYVDLDKPQEELDDLYKEILAHKDRYISVPKLTFYEIKKVMESFVNEKIYDVDTKERLLDIIQSREARENFLEFMYDHHGELEKWQQYYQERFRIRMIEWLRGYSFDFVFEEDVELAKSLVEKIKINMFTAKVAKDIAQARKLLVDKAATYYLSEALHPRPKRGRPPKLVVKVETEPQFSQDIYLSVPKAMKPFLFTPDYNSSSMLFTFSGKFTSEEDLLAHRKRQSQSECDLQTLSQKLEALRALSVNWNKDSEKVVETPLEEEHVEESFERQIEQSIASRKELSSAAQHTTQAMPIEKEPVKKKESVAKTSPKKGTATKEKVSAKKTSEKKGK